ncbi:MAG: hypothetical protein KC933_26875 [Myxococcales bacterium]|nr:hypothetical protein [Myxococcales bacterium]
MVAGLVLIASASVAGLGLLRLARSEANAGVTVIAGALGLAVAALMLRSRPELRTSAAAAITAVVVGLLGTEAFLAYQTFRASARPGTPDSDARSVLEVVRDLNAKGTPAVPALLSSYARASGSELVPLGGVADATTVFCNEAGQYVIYRSDEDGFNNPPDGPGEVEFVVLGDSFAHGQCVPQGMDVAGRLRARGHTALNLGCAGTGPLSALGALLEYGLAAYPKTVLWFYYEGNDPLDLEAELRSPTLARYLDGAPHQGLRARRADVEAYWRAYLARVPDPGRAAVLNPQEILRSIISLRRIRRLFDLTSTFPSATAVSLRQVLSVGVAATKEVDAEVVFVYIPASARLDNPRFQDHRREIFDVAIELGLRTIDFAETVSGHPDPKSLYPNRGLGHFDEDGYELLTETILRCVATSSTAGEVCS